ncbi:FAD/FMN-dependent dehydrogenase [Bernardetia litoralis DSM 6794]|uniref:FAD/FMN-dependent dehydrogenase n=1 Tax=Bernardetia litoralis (strain ATCC 23117 / DSM 6794 / NBRC 15988 / NCIMB 1366 / Fx l1 / Sio-4) TaxID=880071 RepID=I4AL45_BERLS|nr:FAD-dependent oxidoreductase [Bernardetia litoralis]AFM04680.1 FAD/FMN-dependent dehydrogenase [Bernardetia litoralis DSM 6794]
MEKFINECKLILGGNNVEFKENPTILLRQATFDFPAKVEAVLYPTSVTQLSDCFKIANKYKQPLYVVSRGNNIGLGSALPPKEDSILIDLSKMDTITDFSEEMAYITVEAGVSFEQVFSFLEENNSSLMMDSIGSTSKASVVGNTADRGHGMGMYADRFSNVCGFEVVLPNGEIIQTGYTAYAENNKIAPLAKGGVGASLDGLFTQSNLGIITKLTFWLKPKTDFLQTFYFEIEADTDCGKVAEEWKKLRLLGLQASLRIFSDTRLIAFNMQKPTDKEWSEELRKELRESIGVENKWIGFGGIYSASELHAKADKKIIINSIGTIAKNLVFYDKSSSKNANSDEEKAKTDFFYETSVLRGYVSDKPLEMCYWGKNKAYKQKINVYQDLCGVLWYCPIIPQTQKDVQRAIEIVETCSLKYKLEPNVGFLFVSERTIDITGAICYDREQEGEEDRAVQCHNEIMEAFISEGYAPYRLGIQSMDLMKKLNPSTLNFLRHLKNSIDPNHILSKNRYII